MTNGVDRKEVLKILEERFLRYVRICTTSDSRLAESKTPSTPGQWDLLRLLEQELKELGLKDVNLNDQGYLIARLPGRVPGNLPCVGFMAHVDTAEDAPGKDVKPCVHRSWQGEVIQLEEGVTLDPEEIPAMKDFVGQTLITSDGRTLLGADDKAGVAEIMTAVEILQKNQSLKHGPVEIIFTPDEETGCGMNHFPLKDLQSSLCLTMDGGHEGEVELECYNAWRVDLHIQGRVIHPGAARGKLVNAAAMAGMFISLLPRSESPEATDGRYGNYWVHEVEGHLDKAFVSVMIRDFEDAGIQRRLQALRSFAAAVEAAFPGGKIRLEEKEQYKNMKKELDKHPELEGFLKKVCESVGIEADFRPIRGGTDGSRLTEMGIPAPNIFAGGMNFHSVREWVPLKSMGKAVEFILSFCLAFPHEKWMQKPGI